MQSTMRTTREVTFLILAIYAIKGIQTNYTNNVLPEDAVVYQKYIEMDKNLQSMVKSAVRMIMPYVMEASQHLNVSSQCTRDLFQLISELRKLKLPAISFLDATGKLPDGFLWGRNYLLGDFEECLNATLLQRNGAVAFRGQYCVISVKPLLPSMKKSQTLFTADKQLLEATKNVSDLMKLFMKNLQLFYFADMKLGICVPTGCNPKDIDEMINYLGKRLDIHTKVDYCDHEGKYPPFRPKMIFAICFLCFFGLLAFIGTFIEYYSNKRNIILKSSGSRVLQCFSLLTNFPKLINTKTSENTLKCLFGIRSLSLFYVMLLHEYAVIREGNMYAHLMKTVDVLQGLFVNILSNGLLVVEVFFFIGGLVNCYSRMKMNKDSKQKENTLLLLFHRLWRIYPALILATFIMPTIFEQPYGPRRSVAIDFLRICDTAWWKNMLFVNNFFDQKESVCMPQTWYISADIHLFIISLFTIPVFFKHRKAGIVVHLLLILFGLVFSSTWVWKNNVYPAPLTITPFEKETRQYWNTYTLTPPNIAPYFAGVLVGYFLYVKQEFKIPKVLQLIGWPIAGVLYTSALFLPKYWNSGYSYTVLEGALYFSISRLALVLGIGWMVICCAVGQGGIINYILSLGIWTPIARISYMAYVVSPAIQIFFGANMRLIYDYHNMIYIWWHFGDIVCSLLISLVLVVLVESPFVSLEKIILRK